MSLARFLRDGHTHHPEKTALIFGEQTWTYAEVDTLTDRLATNLLAQGLKPRDRVALHMSNCPELVFSYYGCFKVGAIAVPINERMGPSEIEYFLQHSEARFYIGQPDLYQPVLSIRPHLPQLHQCYLTGDSQFPDTGAFQNLLTASSGTVEWPAVEPGQVAAILYTSGTTARPKGVTHTHEALHYMIGLMEQMGMSRERVAAPLTPMTHMAAFMCIMLSALTVGATLVLPTGSDPQTILGTLERHRALGQTAQEPLRFRTDRDPLGKQAGRALFRGRVCRRPPAGSRLPLSAGTRRDQRQRQTDRLPRIGPHPQTAGPGAVAPQPQRSSAATARTQRPNLPRTPDQTAGGAVWGTERHLGPASVTSLGDLSRCCSQNTFWVGMSAAMIVGASTQEWVGHVAGTIRKSCLGQLASRPDPVHD